MNEATPDSVSHNKVVPDSVSHNNVVPDSVFCNEWIHLEFCIHKSSLIL